MDLTKGEFRLLGYILRHTINFRNERVRMTDDEVLNGRKRANGQRIDAGCGLSTNTMKEARDGLVARGMIIVEDGYYSPNIDNENGQEVLSETDSQLSETDKTRYNIYRENNNREAEGCETLSSDGYSQDFLVFWDAFGKIGSKYQAQKSWKSAKKLANADFIVDAARRYHNDLKSKGKLEYSKHASTWLNNRCWADKLPTHSQPTKEAVKSNVASNKPVWMCVCDGAIAEAKKKGAREVVQLYFKEPLKWQAYAKNSQCTAGELYTKMCRDVQGDNKLPDFIEMIKNAQS